MPEITPVNNMQPPVTEKKEIDESAQPAPKSGETRQTYILPAIAVIIILVYFLVLPTITLKNPLLTNAQAEAILGTGTCYTETITNSSLFEYGKQFPQIQGNVSYGWGLQCKKTNAGYTETLSELVFQTNSSAGVSSSLYSYSLNHLLALSATSNIAVNTTTLSGAVSGARYSLSRVVQQKGGESTTTIILTESRNDNAALVVLYNTSTSLNTSFLVSSVAEKLN